VISQDRGAARQAMAALRHAAGNFYINDKPTGAVVGQQPFGGARASGTNDKAGSYLNLIRWISPRSVKETFVPPLDYRYPFMKPGKTEAAAEALEDLGEKLGVQIEELKGHLGALGGTLKERLEGAVEKARAESEGRKVDVESGDDGDSA
jgi:delta 1-pyrroline-5-carboxylate dehydrogenase